MTYPHIGLVAEDGAESIIPLTGKRRRRGLELWERTGEILGVMPHARGSIFGSGAKTGISGENTAFMQDIIDSMKVSRAGNTASFDPAGKAEMVNYPVPQVYQAGTEIKVEVSMQPTFQFGGITDGTGDNHVVQVIKENIRTMADDIGDEIAGRLSRIFQICL